MIKSPGCLFKYKNFWLDTCSNWALHRIWALLYNKKKVSDKSNNKIPSKTDYKNPSLPFFQISAQF